MHALPRSMGRYRLLERIGAGGMGEVYRAELSGEGGFRRRCAIKMVLPHRSSDDDVSAMFEREAILAARVVHDNVVQVFDFGKDPDTGALYLVMEYVDGLNLRALAERVWQRGEVLEVQHVCAFIADAARGLAAIHGLLDVDGRAVPLVHRDVTPDNIMITRGGGAKIGDFGIAVARDMARLTETGQLKGKVPYLSPEQLDEGELSPAADVFSLGVTLHYLLTGKRPFDRGTELGTMNAIVNEEPPSLNEERPEVGHRVVDLARLMLHKRPERRPTAAFVAEALIRAQPGAGQHPTALVAQLLGPSEGETAEASLPPQTTGPSLPSLPAPITVATRPLRAARPRSRLAAAGLLLTCAVGAFVTLLWPRTPAPSPEIALVDAGATRVDAAVVDAAVVDAAVVDAAVVDAAVDAAVVDAAVVDAAVVDAAVVDAGSNVAVAPLNRLREVELVGPSSVTWFSVEGKKLGTGTTQARLKPGARTVVAADAALASRCFVAVANGAARYDSIAVGELDVRANPYAEVILGSRSLGTTPLTPLPKLAACVYRVRLSYEGKKRQETVKIVAGSTTRLRVDMEPLSR